MNRDEPVSLNDLARRLLEPWKPQDVVQVNEAVLRLARLDGTFPWHITTRTSYSSAGRADFESRWRVVHPPC